MTITQPEDKTLTKERIEAILIVANHLMKSVPMPHAMRSLQELNNLPNLKGEFAHLGEGEEIVFVAQ